MPSEIDFERVDCPFCGKKMHCGISIDMNGKIVELYHCTIPGCNSPDYAIASKSVWKFISNALKNPVQGQ